MPYQELKVFDGEQHIDSVTTGKDAVWLCELINLSRSEHPIRVEVRPGVDSGIWSFTVEELVNPTIDEVKDVAGTTIGDTVTTNKTPLTLTGTVADGQKVDIYDGANKLGEATITAPGKWAFKTSVLSSLKAYAFKAVEQGVGGTESATRTVAVTEGPRWIYSAYANGTPVDDGASVRTTNLSLAGGLPPGTAQYLEIWDKDSRLGTIPLPQNQQWSYQVADVRPKEYSFTVKVPGGTTVSIPYRVTVLA
ncbi:hypothetical protein [Pseudomonas fluorescens]|uniref:hypothetical protein n=1 Tax=Pseudomonas fluorescens TaxID=294 RepID=UPI003D02105E